MFMLIAKLNIWRAKKKHEKMPHDGTLTVVQVQFFLPG